MTVLRLGKVTTPHKKHASVLLTRVDGNPLRIPIEQILFWEEVTLKQTLQSFVCVHYDLSATAVRESFTAIDELINGKAVQS